MANINFNKVILGGRMVDNPELKTTPSGTPVVSFPIAVNNFKGEGQFFTVTAWQKTAEFICQYFGKGSSIVIEGALSSRSYNDKNGEKRYVTEVVADKAYFVDSKEKPQAAAPAPVQTAPVFETIADDEEIPF